MRRVWHVVLLTSAAWFLLDVFILFYFIDYVKNVPDQRTADTYRRTPRPAPRVSPSSTEPAPPELQQLLNGIFLFSFGL